jgi:hydrogenase maturation protein HypF
LQYVPMPGGEAAIREPWRMALGALTAAGIDADLAAKLTGASPQDARVIEQMIVRKINTPITSSLGRLFDAVAALVLNLRVVDYEAQAAIELEGLALREDGRIHDQRYVPELWAEGDGNVLKTEYLWQAIIEHLQEGRSKARIAAEFHAGIAEGFIAAAGNARNKFEIEKVVLSGGCLHNRRLAWLLREGLEEAGFQVYQHRKVSPGDGGLSYGQAVIGAAILQKES